MADRQHYVSQFHLREFVDPLANQSAAPWVWVANLKQSTIKKRAPHNFAWSRGLFEGPGALANRQTTLESHFATEVENAAATALRELIQGKVISGAIAPEITRYLAWAAARSLPMKSMFQDWINANLLDNTMECVEPPLVDAYDIHPIHRNFKMEHSVTGLIEDVTAENIEKKRRDGWRLLLSNDDFLEIMHLQAWYFQARFFPRLKWIILRAPANKYFILGDRPVAWGFSGKFDARPSALRLPTVQLFAPLTRSIALFAHHADGAQPVDIAADDVNKFMAKCAHSWLAGPTENSVIEALAKREIH